MKFVILLLSIIAYSKTPCPPLQYKALKDMKKIDHVSYITIPSQFGPPTESYKEEIMELACKFQSTAFFYEISDISQVSDRYLYTIKVYYEK
jgi:hypothetical protein